MKRPILFQLRVLGAVVVLAILTGCSIIHPMADDYGRYLEKTKGTSHFQAVKTGNYYYLPAATQTHRYEFRSGLAGYAHVWVVEFGKVLDETMRSKDVVDSFGILSKASFESQGTGNTIIFDLQSYRFENFGAQIVLKISVKNATREIFTKTYHANGLTQGAKFATGPLRITEAVQESTKLALDEIINSFIRDFKDTNN